MARGLPYSCECGGEPLRRNVLMLQFAIDQVHFVMGSASSLYMVRDSRLRQAIYCADDLFRVAHNGANQFNETRSDSQKNSRQVKPGRMQPTIESSANQPSNHQSCRKHNRQLAVAASLDPEIFFAFGVRRIGIDRHSREFRFCIGSKNISNESLSPPLHSAPAPATSSRSR